MKRFYVLLLSILVVAVFLVLELFVSAFLYDISVTVTEAVGFSGLQQAVGVPAAFDFTTNVPFRFQGGLLVIAFFCVIAFFGFVIWLVYDHIDTFYTVKEQTRSW